ncbi:MAG: hypothetical protein V5A68_07950 [Candidatus Thermoplasmatota archaeon]
MVFACRTIFGKTRLVVSMDMKDGFVVGVDIVFLLLEPGMVLQSGM